MKIKEDVQKLTFADNSNILKGGKMAKIKKAAAKTAAKPKSAAKKPAAKKPAAKKPAAKATAKKPAAKTTAKKPAAKTAAKKPAAKTTAKKPAAKAAVKKPAAKAAVKKPAAKPAVKKPAAADVKFRDLFEAYMQKKLPFDNGYIVSSFFSDTSFYSIYEIVSYAGVKEIFPTDTGLQFTTGGKKLYVLVEPDTYQLKFEEPTSRSNSQGERIPKRFDELDLIIAKNQTKIYIAKEPDETLGSFTILKPQAQNFAVVFYQLPDVYKSLSAFFEMSLNRQRKVPQADAKKASQLIATTVEKTMGFKGEFE